MPRFHDLLAPEHDELAVLLRQALGPPLDAAAAEKLRALLLRHIAKEERVLFPAAKSALGHAIPGMATLRADHAALASLMVPTPTAEILGLVQTILEEHDELEEGPDGIYEACERALTAPQIEDVCRALANVGPVPLAPHFDGPEAMANVRRLIEQRGCDRGQPTR
jgi:hypothetical protein